MTTNPEAEIVSEVRAQAAKRRATQTDLAGILNLSRMSISRRMNGTVPFTTAELFTLAGKFGIPVSTFFQSAPVSATPAEAGVSFVSTDTP